MNVTITGAGVVGCAIAYQLARRGAVVRVIDPRGVGQGATQASAGILAPAIEGRSADLLRLLTCSRSLYDGFVARLQADANTTIEYERTGTLQVALDDQEAASLVSASERLSAMRVTHELLTPADAVRLEPSLTDRLTRALLVPEDGYVAVGGLLDGLEAAAVAHGVVFTRSRVHEIESHPGGARALTESEGIESDAVIVAAGSWLPDLAGGSIRPVPVRPIRGQLVRLRSHERLAAHVLWGHRCYAVPWQDGSVLVGATVEDVGFDERATAAGVQEMLEAGMELIPALSGASFEEVRVGLRPMAADGFPVIGQSSTLPHVFYASGHYRNGVLLAPLTAALVADLVLDGRVREELSMMRPDRLGL